MSEPESTVPSRKIPVAIRKALSAAPSYPFTAIDAPIKLDQNESPEDFPEALKKLALEKMLSRAWNRYPSMMAENIRGLLALRENWPDDGTVITPGSNVLLQHLAEAAGIGATVLTVSPGFAIYKQVGMFLANELIEIPLGQNFELPLAALLKTMQQKSGVLYLAVPHAPTGVLHSRQDLEQIIAASKNWIVLLDEAYYEFCGTNHKDFLSNDNVAVLRTFSKAWGLAGVRAGYLLAQPVLAAQIQKIALPFNLNLLTECVLEVALLHPEYREARIQEMILERERIRRALAQHPSWQVYESSANFLLIRTPNAVLVYNELLARGILVRRQDSQPGLVGCLRVSVGTVQENNAFLHAAMQIA